MRNKYTGIRALALSLCTVVFIGVSTGVVAHATGAGIQLGTDITEEVVPQADVDQSENADTEAVNAEADQDVTADTNEALDANGEETADAVASDEEQSSTDSSDEALSEDELKADSKMAFIAIENYSLEGGLLEAGNDITINITLANLSSTSAAENVVMTMSSDAGMIYPRYGTDNQIFIGNISAGESKKISVPVTVSSRFEGDVTDFTCQFNYLSQGNKISNESRMAITTSGGKSLIVKSVDLSTHAILNGKSLLNINYSNKTNGNITDAELLIDGNVSGDSKIIRLDTIYAGKSYSKDFSVSFVKGGNQQVNIRLVYTDLSGERMQTDLGTYSVTVSEEVISTNSYVTNRGLLWGGRAIAAIMLLVALYVCFTYYKKR